jgi:DNA-binding MarR family transcriptional regulator
VTGQSSSVYRFGDLLALAREYWVREMAGELARAGFPDYRRSDAVLLRLLLRGPCPVGRIGTALGVTRQAARKLVAGLERRGYAHAATSERDARRLDVSLTARGEAFASAIVAAVDALNARTAQRVDFDQLAAADAVLRAVLPDARARTRADRLIPPPRGSDEGQNATG